MPLLLTICGATPLFFRLPCRHTAALYGPRAGFSEATACGIAMCICVSAYPCIRAFVYTTPVHPCICASIHLRICAPVYLRIHLRLVGSW
jgi:hypothetical protein